MKLKQCLLLSCLALGIQGANYTYDYDSAGRLLAIKSADAPPLSYSYDLAGNILHLGPPATGDSDQDQLPDDWELANFGSLNETGSGDFDGDGQTNLEEFIAGTDPADKNSSLRIIEATVTGGAAKLLIQTVAGRTYQLQSKATLGDPSWSDKGTRTATGTTIEWQDLDPIQTSKFFRIVLVP